MRSPESHKIDRMAQAILAAKLAEGWTLAPLVPDYAKDFLAERIVDGVATGQTFIVQLKGSKRLTRRSGSNVIAVRLRAQHLEYYAQRLDIPAILVAIDVSSQDAYWLFLQRYMYENRTAMRSSHKSHSVFIPISNTLDDCSSLAEVLATAPAYLASLTPSVVTRALAVQRSRLEDLDSRFEYSISLQNESYHVSLTPKETVHFSIDFQGPSESLAVLERDLIDKGLPVRLDDIRASVRGLQALEDPLGKGSTIQFARSSSVSADLAVLDSVGAERGRIRFPPCRLEGGRLESRVTLNLPDCPVSFDFRMTHSCPPSPSAFSLRIELSRWVSRPLLCLPYFSGVHAAFANCQPGDVLLFELMRDGQDPVQARAVLPDWGYASHFSSFLAIVARARLVSQYYQVEPTLPPQFSDDDLDALDHLEAFMCSRAIELDGQADCLSCELTRDGASQFLAKAITPEQPGVLCLRSSLACTLFGCQVRVDGVESRLTRAVLGNCSEVREQLERGEDVVALRFLGTRGSRRIMRRVETPSREPRSAN